MLTTSSENSPNHLANNTVSNVDNSIRTVSKHVILQTGRQHVAVGNCTCEVYITSLETSPRSACDQHSQILNLTLWGIGGWHTRVNHMHGSTGHALPSTATQSNTCLTVALLTPRRPSPLIRIEMKQTHPTKQQVQRLACTARQANPSKPNLMLRHTRQFKTCGNCRYNKRSA